MQPSKTDLGFGACTATNDEAGIAGQCHEQVSRVAHAARHHNGGRPVRRRHLVGRDDAENQSPGGYGALCGHSSGRTAATADYSDAVARKKCTGLASKFVCGGTWLGAAEYTHLRLTDGRGWHCDCLCGLAFELGRERRCAAWTARRKIRTSATWSKCHAGASRLQRRVRPHWLAWQCREATQTRTCSLRDEQSCPGWPASLYVAPLRSELTRCRRQP